MKIFYRLTISTLLLAFISASSFAQVTAAFEYFNEGGNCEGPQQIYFMNMSQGDILYHFWDFGDGHSSSDMNPMHEYQADGMYYVTLTVYDSMFVDTTSQIVEVFAQPDFTPPNAYCKNLTLSLDQTGSASISEFEVDNGSWDECSGIIYDTDFTSFSCSDVGLNIVALTVTDDFGNSSSCMSMINIQDNTGPIAICQDITLALDVEGYATISESAVDSESWDNCSSLTYDTDITVFSCANVGANTVTLSVVDANGNTSSCMSTIAVVDNIPPIAACQDITVSLDEQGNAIITEDAIDNESWDECGSVTVDTDLTEFTETEIGFNNVVLTVVDLSGNSSTCNSTVTVEDYIPENQPPVAVCQNAVVELDEEGTVSIDPSILDGGSSDDVFIESMSLDMNFFDCENVGENQVVLTVGDDQGATSTCLAIVTIEDNIAPVWEIPGDIVVSSEPGQCFATVYWESPVATDNCSIGLSLSTHNPGDQFENGTTTVTTTASDNAGNLTTASFTVTVMDDEMPEILNCVPYIYSSTNIVVLPEPIVAIDNCGIESFVSSHNWANPFPFGWSIVTTTVTDYEGNTSSCATKVRIGRPIKPSLPGPDLGFKNLEADVRAFSLYPNPAREIIKLAFSETDVTRSIQVFDLTGRMVNEINSSRTIVSVNVSEYQPGMYFVKVKDANGDTSSKKFFVE